MASFCSRESCSDCSGRLICRCLQVTESQLIEVLNTLPVRTLNDIRKLTGAGDGCTACHGRLQQLVEAFSYASPSCSLR